MPTNKTKDHTIEIDLISVGRNKYSGKKQVKNPSMSTVRKAIQPHLGSKGWDLQESDEPHVYDIVCGFRPAGQVKIEKDHWLLLL